MKIEFPEGVEPNMALSGVPFCDHACRSYDGKRCEKLGFRPAAHCEPAIVHMFELLKKAQS